MEKKIENYKEKKNKRLYLLKVLARLDPGVKYGDTPLFFSKKVHLRDNEVQLKLAGFNSKNKLSITLDQAKKNYCIFGQ